MQWPFGSHWQVAASSRRVIAACFVQTCIRRTLDAQLTDPTSSSRSSSCSIKNHPNAESIIGSGINEILRLALYNEMIVGC